jgi:ferric-dicitrate binding protein FerR (iron transport regulator)
LLAAHLTPGHLVYMQVQAEAPEALSAFVTWVAANEAHQRSLEMAEERRDAFYAVNRDDALTALWREATHVSSRIAVNLAESMAFLRTMLRRAGVGNPDEWAQTRLRALETEAGEKLEAAS